MAEETVNGPEVSDVTEMIKALPREKIYESTRCAQARYLDQEGAPN